MVKFSVDCVIYYDYVMNKLVDEDCPNLMKTNNDNNTNSKKQIKKHNILPKLRIQCLSFRQSLKGFLI